MENLTEKQLEVYNIVKNREVLDKTLNPDKNNPLIHMKYWSRNIINKSVWINGFTEIFNTGFYDYPDRDQFVCNGYNYSIHTSELQPEILYVTRQLV